MKRKNHKSKQEAIAQIHSFNPREAIELFPADDSKSILFYPDKKTQIGHLIARQKQTPSKAEEIINLGFRTYPNLEEICCFVAMENYGTVKLVRDKMQMVLIGSFIWENSLFCYYSKLRYSRAIV